MEVSFGVLAICTGGDQQHQRWLGDLTADPWLCVPTSRSVCLCRLMTRRTVERNAWRYCIDETLVVCTLERGHRQTPRATTIIEEFLILIFEGRMVT